MPDYKILSSQLSVGQSYAIGDHPQNFYICIYQLFLLDGKLRLKQTIYYSFWNSRLQSKIIMDKVHVIHRQPKRMSSDVCKTRYYS